MNILVINCGSSSLGFKVYDSQQNGVGRIVAAGKARNVATHTRAEPMISWEIGEQKGSETCALDSHRLAAENVLSILRDHQIEVDAIGHRFVHGGDRFKATTRINEMTMEILKECLPLAPILT